MKKQKITKEIYIAEDGREFLTKEECEKYEDFVKNTLSRIRYFRIICEPDLTETGCYQRHIEVAVLAPKWNAYQKEVAFEWALRKFGHYLMEGVQGWGFMPSFKIMPISREEYEKEPDSRFSLVKERERVFLSPEPVEGFPENYNYMKEWGFK